MSKKTEILIILFCIAVLFCPVRVWEDQSDPPCGSDYIFCEADNGIGLFIGFYPSPWIANFLEGVQYYNEWTPADAGVSIQYHWGNRFECWPCEGGDMNLVNIPGNAIATQGSFIEVNIGMPGHWKTFRIWEHLVSHDPAENLGN